MIIWASLVCHQLLDCWFVDVEIIFIAVRDKISVECLPSCIVTEDLYACEDFRSLPSFTYLEVLLEHVKSFVIIEYVLKGHFVENLKQILEIICISASLVHYHMKSLNTGSNVKVVTTSLEDVHLNNLDVVVDVLL